MWHAGHPSPPVGGRGTVSPSSTVVPVVGRAVSADGKLSRNRHILVAITLLILRIDKVAELKCASKTLLLLSQAKL